MSDRGTPFSYRNMDGFGSHTFSLIDKNNQRVWVKFHFKTLQGIKNFTEKEANEMKGIDLDQAQRDMVDAIARKDFPKWAMKGFCPCSCGWQAMCIMLLLSDHYQLMSLGQTGVF